MGGHIYHVIVLIRVQMRISNRISLQQWPLTIVSICDESCTYKILFVHTTFSYYKVLTLTESRNITKTGVEKEP